MVLNPTGRWRVTIAKTWLQNQNSCSKKPLTNGGVVEAIMQTHTICLRHDLRAAPSAGSAALASATAGATDLG